MDLPGVVGASAGVAALAVAVWQLRVALTERRDRRTPGRPAASIERTALTEALPVDAPLGRLPAEVFGRDELVAELTRALLRRRRRPAGVWVLAGLGGMGKSTVALQVAAQADRGGRKVWWINAGDAVSLRGGLLEILRQTGAPDEVVHEVRDGRPTAPGRFWRFLASRRNTALLVFDNADDPALLSAGGHGSPGDGDGWLRPDPPVFTLVTTRTADPAVWGDWIALRRLAALPEDRAAALLRGLALNLTDPDGTGARSLARRLGGLPLALRLAGTYLASPFNQWGTFEEYRTALDATGTALAELDLESRGLITRTWEISLDALATQGLASARPMLYLLACFDPLTPAIAPVLGRFDGTATLRGLADVALVDVAARSGMTAVTLHPVVADVCRARLGAGGHDDLIREAAEDLSRAAAGLDAERVADWPAWERLVPHIAAFAGWAAPCLDEASLVAVLNVGRRAADALWVMTSAALWGSGGGHRVVGDDLVRALGPAADRLGGEHPARIMARYCSAVVLLRAGDHAGAEAVFGEVLDMAERVLGPRHRDTLLVRDGLGGLYLAQQRYPEAERVYRQLIADQRLALGADDPDTLTTCVDLAWAVGMQGRCGEAAQICATVVETDRRALGPEHIRTLDARSDLARWLVGDGRLEEARAEARDLLTVSVRVLGARHPMSLLTRAVIAKARAADGHQAVTELDEVLAELDETVGPLDYRTVLVRQDRAEALAAQDRHGAGRLEDSG